ncbi:MAG: hypothetical protein ABIH09_00665, partial [Candidatus Omnitrophota bacterium]
WIQFWSVYIWGAEYGISPLHGLGNMLYQFGDWIAPGIPGLWGIVAIPVLFCCVLSGFVDIDKLNKGGL